MPPADLAGCIPILCTPFAADGALDLPSLEREVDWVIAEGARGVACLAIASEGYKLTEGERDEVVRVVVATVSGRAPVVVSANPPPTSTPSPAPNSPASSTPASGRRR